MCSITDQLAVATPAARLAALVEHQAEVGALIAELLRDPRVADAAGDADGALADRALADAALDVAGLDVGAPVDGAPDGAGVHGAAAVGAGASARVDVGALPPDAAAGLTTTLLATADRAAAAASVLVGHLCSVTGPGTGTLIGGRYASPRRWLEVEAGLAPGSARAVLARARDLREHAGLVGDAWLAGRVSGDAVRELTSGVSGMLKPVPAPRAVKQVLRAEAVELLLPVAEAGTPEELKKALARMRVLCDPDGATQAAMEAYDEQSLSCVQVGDLSVLSVRLTHQNAAAVLTVVDQYARRIAEANPEVTHDASCPLHDPAPPAGSTRTRWCSCGASAAAGVTSKDRWPHLRAVAFAEVLTNSLDDALVGSRHGAAPHVTFTVDAAQLAAGLGGCLDLPGQDSPIPLPPETVHRILCDATITPVVVRRLTATDPATCTQDLATLLAAAAVHVLYVGRTERTVTPRLRRAVVARDRHCVFPGCRAHPRRCEAHHVIPWEHGGPTNLDNLALLCVRHHHSVHEGGWTLALRPDAHPHQTGCWDATPPRPQP